MSRIPKLHEDSGEFVELEAFHDEDDDHVDIAGRLGESDAPQFEDFDDDEGPQCNPSPLFLSFVEIQERKKE